MRVDMMLVSFWLSLIAHKACFMTSATAVS